MFSGILINKHDSGQTVEVAQIDETQLPEGDVTVDVEVQRHATVIEAESGRALRRQVDRPQPIIVAIEYVRVRGGAVASPYEDLDTIASR